MQKELKQLYASLSEILRHFWAAFPPSSPQLVEKTNRMIDALHRFSQVFINNSLVWFKFLYIVFPPRQNWFLLSKN